jgi:glycosyltransferase involved in cell wall biosynthesis
VVLHRVPWGDDVAELIRRARGEGKEVLFDTDDLVFDPDAVRDTAVVSELPPNEARLYIEGVHRYRRTLEHCQGATVSTEPLAVRIRAIGVPALMTPNVASTAMVASASQALETAKRGRAADGNRAERTVVGYMSGTITHRKDFAVAAESLVTVLRDRPQTELRVVGPLEVNVPLDDIEGRATFLPLQPWSLLADIQASIDINLAPLEPKTAFTECKSSIKWLEAALVARPTVASPEPDFQRVIRQGENGFLATSPHEWQQTIEELVDNADLRHRVGQRAREDALRDHTAKARSIRYLGALRNLASRPEAPLIINWLLYSPIRQNAGGYRNIFRIANLLAEHGHQQRMIVNPVAHLSDMDRREISDFIDDAFGIPNNSDVHIGHDSIPEADVSLATFWPTAYTVAEHRLSRFKGYFIQDFEANFYEGSDPKHDEAAATYSLPLRHICLGTHLGDQIQRLTGVPSAVVDFALDSHFRIDRRPEERGRVPRVLFFARPSLARRGYTVGIEALAELKWRHPETEITFFGTPSEELGPVPFDFKNLGVIDAPAVAQAMNEAHILLTFSLTNISNVPFEGMACGCGVVELDGTNVSAMTNPGENCLLTSFEPSKIADAVARLIEDPDLRIKLGNRGAADMAGRTWERTASMFDSALRELCILPIAARQVRATTP